jgi:hypothetical protein
MSTTDAPVPVPGSALIFFFFITLGFTLFTLISIQNARSIESMEKAKDSSLLNIIYICILVIGSYFINTTISKALCNSQSIQWTNILLATLLPWIVIFFSLYVVLKLFPGWISPFSNTIGYLVISILGVEKTLTEILNDENNTNADVAKAIANIKNNKSNFINQIDIDRTDFNSFITSLISAGIITLKNPEATDTESESTEFAENLTENTNENNPNIQNLYKLLIIKNVLGKITWYALAGVLVTSVSYNYIINMSCEKSLEEIQTDLDNAEAAGVDYVGNTD